MTGSAAPRSRVALAWSVHLFTASGAVIGALALAAIVAGDLSRAAIWMLVALVIDSVDGTFARAARVSTVLPDLRRSAAIENRDTFTAIVHDGALKDSGMVSFAPSLSRERVEGVRQYIIKRAHEDKAIEGSGA